MYTDAMAAATMRQSDAEITHVFKNQNQGEHDNIINIHHLHQWEKTEQQAIEKELLTGSPLMKTRTPAAAANKQPASAGTLGEKDAASPAHRFEHFR